MAEIYLKPSQYSLEVVGEQSYQKAIKEVILYEHMVEKEDLEYSDPKLTAQLVLEDGNKFDPGNAVRVDIENKTVGYLAKEDARLYRVNLEKLGHTKDVITCNAKVFGKRDELGKPMRFGVWLDIDLRRKLEIGEAPPKKKGCFGLVGSIIAFVFIRVLIS